MLVSCFLFCFLLLFDVCFVLLLLVVDKIRENPKSKGLVYANGMFVTKHAIGIYGKGRPKYKWEETHARLAAVQEAIYHLELPPLVDKGTGLFKVEAYIINHSKRTGKPQSGVVLGTLVETGERTLADIDASGQYLFFFFMITPASLLLQEII